MSPKLRRLSGKEVLSILAQFVFSVHNQKGSHVKLRRTLAGEKQTLTAVIHDELDMGTLRAIFKTGKPIYSRGAIKERILFRIAVCFR